MPREVKRELNSEKFDCRIRKVKNKGGTKNPYAMYMQFNHEWKDKAHGSRLRRKQRKLSHFF
jgi:hypothetical protein